MKFPWTLIRVGKRRYLQVNNRVCRIEISKNKIKDVGDVVGFRVEAGRDLAVHMSDSGVPLSVLLKGLGFTLEDCRRALEESEITTNE